MGGWLTPGPGRCTPARTYCIGGWVGPRAGAENLAATEILSRAVQTEASRYTDCAIAAQFRLYSIEHRSSSRLFWITISAFVWSDWQKPQKTDGSSWNEIWNRDLPNTKCATPLPMKLGSIAHSIIFYGGIDGCFIPRTLPSLFFRSWFTSRTYTVQEIAGSLN